MIAYQDGVAATEWLAKAFGFVEQRRFLGPDGRLAHGEMLAGGGLIMLAAPSPDYESPKRHREHCDQARRWSAVPWIVDGVLVYVDNAVILSAPEDGSPGRRYRVEDIEGHRWMFMERPGPG